jgi:3alpha(or 20beta)-hydroxysteroid dehydrogenase
MRLANRLALVTGGARGLGASIVRLFYREGARVIIADLRDAEGEALAASLGERAHYERLDVSCEADWIRVLRSTTAKFGAVNALVNCAGIYRVKPFLETTLADYELVVSINQNGTFLGMRQCIPGMIAAGGGAIVNIASTAGLEGVAQALPYTASKHAVVGMTRAAALEMAMSGIRINAVCPGAMLTPLLAEAFSASLDTLAAMDMPSCGPMRRMGKPEEIANTVLFLVSDEASYINGSVVVIDGGMTAGLMQ